jgi:hypothetical protein
MKHGMLTLHLKKKKNEADSQQRNEKNENTSTAAAHDLDSFLAVNSSRCPVLPVH